MSNPVLKLELLHQHRPPRARLFWLGRTLGSAMLLVVLLVLGIGALLCVTMSLLTAIFQPDKEAWRILCIIFTYAQLFAVCTFAPLVCANLFTREREQQTLGMLLLTQLTPGEICWGKLLARMIRLGLLLLVFLPVTLTSALLGGVSPGAVVGTYAVLAVCAFSFGAFGLNVSFSFRRTAVASVIAVSWSVFIWPLLLLSIQMFYYMTGRGFLWGYLSDVQPTSAIIALLKPLNASYSPPPEWSLSPQWLWVHTLLWHGAIGYRLVANVCYVMRRRSRDRIL